MIWAFGLDAASDGSRLKVIQLSMEYTSGGEESARGVGRSVTSQSSTKSFSKPHITAFPR